MTQHLTRYALMACGWIALGFAAAGLVLPVLPTAPFVLLAAACFMRSSERLHCWIVDHPTFGAHVRDYLAGNGLQRRTKVVAVSTLWTSTALTIVVFAPPPPVGITVVTVAAAVTVYLVRLPTCESGEDTA